MENAIHSVLETFLSKMQARFSKIKIEAKADNQFRINIESDEPSLLIGHHGDNIFAIQHLVKLILREKEKLDLNIYIDVDNYRKRQEDNVIKMAEKKVEMARKLNSSQSLPAMSPYFRRLIHLHLAQEKFEDIRTLSEGEGDHRYIIIKPNLVI